MNISNPKVSNEQAKPKIEIDNLEKLTERKDQSSLFEESEEARFTNLKAKLDSCLKIISSNQIEDITSNFEGKSQLKIQVKDSKSSVAV